MVLCQSDAEKESAIEENDLHLSYTEKRIWDMWRRWRVSNKTLYPWQYMTKTVYADDVIDLDAIENMVSKLERQNEEYQRRLEESKSNRPNPNVRSLT